MGRPPGWSDSWRRGSRPAGHRLAGLDEHLELAADLPGGQHPEPGQAEQPGRRRVVQAWLGNVFSHLGPPADPMLGRYGS